MNVTQEFLLQVWKKAKVEPGFDENMFRKDACGAWIVWDKYGGQDNMYGLITAPRAFSFRRSVTAFDNCTAMIACAA